MSAERGWIADPPPPKEEWYDSHYSRMADRIAAKAVTCEEDRRALAAKRAEDVRE